MKKRLVLIVSMCFMAVILMAATPASAKSSTTNKKTTATSVKKNKSKKTTKKKTTKKKVTKKKAPKISKADKKRNSLVTFSKKFLKNRYVWGGTSLKTGADCSGFVQALYKHYGYKIPRTSRDQAKKGKKVSAKNLKKGDLVFYAYGGRIGHVAMYIGGGKIIHSSCPKYGVRISKYNYQRPAVIRRIIN